jgi:hypothetical protein
MRVTELTPGTGGTVLALVHMPGRDERTAYPTGDWAYQVITVREGRRGANSYTLVTDCTLHYVIRNHVFTCRQMRH